MFKLLSNFCIMLMILTSSLMAKSADVYPFNIKKGDTYVQVLRPNEYEVSFNRCRHLIADSCRQIGPLSAYRIQHLIDQRFIEELQAAGAISGVIIAFAGYGWLVLTYGATSVGATFTVLATYPLAGYFFANLLKALNPIDQVMHFKAISSKVINDKMVEVYDIGRFITSLETVLIKLN